MKTIVENNRLIAEFMGYKQDAKGKYEIIEDFDIVENIQTYVEDNDYRTVEGGIVLVNFLPEEMRYHTSWDWLMPVVEKIEYAHDCFVTITLVRAEITNRDLGQRDTPLNDPIFDIETDGKTKHEAIYKAVLKFIEWYNENSQS